MAKSRGKTKAARDEAFKLTEAVGRALRAFAEATTEASLSSLRLVTDTTIDVAEKLAGTFTDAIVEPANIAQRSVDRFFSALSGDKGDGDEEDDGDEDGDKKEDPDTVAMLTRAGVRSSGAKQDRSKGEKPADDTK